MEFRRLACGAGFILAIPIGVLMFVYAGVDDSRACPAEALA